MWSDKTRLVFKERTSLMWDVDRRAVAKGFYYSRKVMMSMSETSGLGMEGCNDSEIYR